MDLSKPTCAAPLLLLMVASTSCALHAQTPASSSTSAPPAHLYVNHNNLFLDAAHGGADDGARIGDRLLEKDLTLVLANRIRTQLGDQPGLNLVLTRDPGVLVTPPPEQPVADLGNNSRAGMANHARPFACILLHATAAGSGVHIITSELAPPDLTAPASPGTPWSTAQAVWVRQSLRLANQVGIALEHAGVPVYLTHASVRPLDSLACPAIALELAPPRLNTNPSTIADPSYQQRVATAVATALIFWRGHTEPVPAAAPAAASTPAAKPSSDQSAPVRTRVDASAATRPKPALKMPAPIIRSPPAAPIVRPAPQPSQPASTIPPPPGALP